ncbi:hypothetical protein TNCV_792851 [Trichonephila clavipes]|nr:hypothetical protein TNCV_792851 [Trichonephila clavipes]
MRYAVFCACAKLPFEEIGYIGTPFGKCSICLAVMLLGIGYVGRGFYTLMELLPWSACSPDLSPIEYVRSMFAQRLARDTSPAATPDQHWQYLETAWTAVPQRHCNEFCVK